MIINGTVAFYLSEMKLVVSQICAPIIGKLKKEVNRMNLSAMN